MTHPVHARLQEALKLRGRTTRSLYKELESQSVLGKKTPGWSYPSVRAYVTGITTPPLEFIQAAANALGVFEPWLTCGYGTPLGVTDWLDSDEAQRAWEEELRACDYAVEEKFLAYRSVGEATRRAVTDLTRWVENLQYVRNPDAFDQRKTDTVWERRTPKLMLNLDLHRTLGEFLRDGLSRVGVERYVHLEGAVDVYIASMCSALKGMLIAELSSLGYYEDFHSLPLEPELHPEVVGNMGTDSAGTPEDGTLRPLQVPGESSESGDALEPTNSDDRAQPAGGQLSDVVDRGD